MGPGPHASASRSLRLPIRFRGPSRKASNTTSKPGRCVRATSIFACWTCPGVKNVRVTYRYPEWTRLQNVVEERGGDLRAVEGTEADLEIETDRPMRDGVLVLDDEKQIRLSGGEGNVYKGTIRMEKDGVYHVAALDQGQPVRLSNDFFIEARKADPPNVIIARPGHDYRASPIEEVTVAVKADDEFGII